MTRDKTPAEEQREEELEKLKKSNPDAYPDKPKK